MPDKISRYRQARLILQIPHEPGHQAYWSLHLLSVTKGRPDARVVLDGYVPMSGPSPSVEEIVECYDAAIRQVMLPQPGE